MDEDEKYNRKLESGLYTLQVRFLYSSSNFLWFVNTSITASKSCSALL